MKNFPVVLISIVLVFIFPVRLSGQNPVKPEDTNTIPESLKMVFQHSCTPCHWAGGGFKSTFHVNFSKWSGYKPEKQAAKAKKICSILQDDDMPPASAREKKPDIVPTKEQVDAICKWSATLNPGSEK